MAEINTTTKEQAKEALKKEIEEAAKNESVQGSDEADHEKEDVAGQDEKRQEEVKKPDTVEHIARDWGWRPKEEFEADPDNEGKQWADPESFVRNQRGISDAYRKREKESQKQLDEMHKTVRGLAERQEAADRRAQAAEKNAREKLLKELETDLDVAAKEGDVGAVRDINKKIVSLTGELKVEEGGEGESEKEAATDTPTTGASSPTVQRWLGRNEVWYDKLDNPLYAAMTLYADKRSAELGKEHTDWQWEQILEQVDKDVSTYRANAERQFAPAKAQRETSAAGGGTPSSNKKKTFNDLTDDQKAKCKQFVTRKAFTDNQAYVDSLFNQ